MNQSERERMVEKLKDNSFVASFRREIRRMDELFCASFSSDEQWCKSMFETMKSLRDKFTQLTGEPSSVLQVRCESGQHLIRIPTGLAIVPKSQCAECNEPLNFRYLYNSR